MYPVKIVTDEEGNKTDVLMSFDNYSELIEEIEDLRDIVKRRFEETISHNELLEILKTDE